MSWNLILQCNYPQGSPSSPAPRCLRGTVRGLAQPAQIHLVSCARSTDRLVEQVFGWIEAEIGSRLTGECDGPATSGHWDGGLHCQAFGEPACRHVLVLFKGAGENLDRGALTLLSGWRARAGVNNHVIVVLPSGESGQHLPPKLRHYQWLVHPAPSSTLGISVLLAAGIGARRRIFLSYRRDDTRTLGDQIHGELTRRGFQVYLDRFSSMPGRLFPEEIAEEIADKGVVLLLESSRLHLSRWTQWELQLARTYHLGILALNVDGAPEQRGIHPSDRLAVTRRSDGELDSGDLDAVTEFVVRRYGLAELRRRVFFEAMVRRAASAAGGQVAVRGDGLFEVRRQRRSALVLPSGRPGNLEDLCQTARASGPAVRARRLLAGQHEHLPAHTGQYVAWLADEIGVSLSSVFGLYPWIGTLLRGGTP